MVFEPGQRLRSRKSGVMYRYALEAPDITKPEDVPDGHIPVRDELWSGNFVWLPETLFVAVDDDFPDAAKG